MIRRGSILNSFTFTKSGPIKLRTESPIPNITRIITYGILILDENRAERISWPKILG